MATTTTRQSRSDGFSLIEVLIVIVVLGILSVVVVLSVRGVVDRGERASCDTDAKVLIEASEAYLATSAQSSIPATGIDADRYERTLHEAGYLDQVSELHELNDDGRIASSAASCN